jgi:deoxyribodipyrimidine photo-lyase
MSTGVVLFTRDLRVHDHPALHAAARDHDRVVPLFVFDHAILSSAYAAPNRIAFLLDSLRDLRSSLKHRGGQLVLRRGVVVDEVRALVEEVGADALHVTADVSRHARRRERALAALADDLDVDLHLHPGVTVVPPGEITTTAGDHFSVFTPYWRRWKDHPHREPVPAPARLGTPATIATGRLPTLADLVDGEPSPDPVPGGETAGRDRVDAWFADGITDYDDGRNDLAGDRTSRLSPYLHFGCISPTEVAARVDLRRAGHETFLSQLCWREYNHQLTWGVDDIGHTSIRPRGDDWRDDEDAVEAWKEGRTGYPVVDAGMRQLRREGWMHNRARMLTAGFLTKQLYIDWRIGAQHFLDWLVDGDIANNSAQWQWTAGVGTDSRPNRMFNPVTQSKRFDPDGAYIRRYVPELATLDAGDVHEPWKLDHDLDYPAPLVGLDEARERFMTARGKA